MKELASTAPVLSTQPPALSTSAAPGTALPLLELRALSRHFGAFTALDSVDFHVRPGEIVGLLGENGAGKSTLISIVGGEQAPSGGELRWDGAPLFLSSARDATARGIGVVHQHFRLVPVFTVAENLALAANPALPGNHFVFNASTWQHRAEAWASSLGWSLNACQRVEELSVGERQRVEIIKALFAGGSAANASSAADSSSAAVADSPGDPATEKTTSSTARLLLLDEPTANLTPREAEELFAVLRRLRGAGCALVFVSHKLNEVLELCDRAVVLRRGRVVGERLIRETDANDLATLMVGRDLTGDTEAIHEIIAPQNTTYPAGNGAKVGAGAGAEAGDGAAAATSEIGPPLSIANLNGGGLKDVSLTVRAGEIVGLAGVDGNGQAALFEMLAGLQKPASGSIEIGGETTKKGSEQLGLIPPDRHREGLILPFDLTENIALSEAARGAARRPLWFNWKGTREKTRALISEYDIRTPAGGERSLAANLSGGNQQKVVIVRALSFGARIVIAVDPTRGLDIGAATFVHGRLREAAARGVAILLISTDLDEVMGLSHRIGVLYEGRLLPGSALLPRGTARETIGELMGGGVKASTVSDHQAEPGHGSAVSGADP